jgi:Tfp pilus assembly protein PilV
MAKTHSIKGISLIEALVCLVVIGIGFIAVSQLTGFAIGSMDRSMERTKVNLLSEMIIEDMYADPSNISNYGNFNETCTYKKKGGSSLSAIKLDKWRDKLNESNYIKVDGKYRKPSCYSGDKKETWIKSETSSRVSGRLAFKTGKGNRSKYLGAVIK